MRLLFFLTALSGLAVSLYSNVGGASLVAASGSCLMISEKLSPPSIELNEFCRSLLKLDWLWSPTLYAGLFILILGVAGFFLAGGKGKSE